MHAWIERQQRSEALNLQLAVGHSLTEEPHGVRMGSHELRSRLGGDFAPSVPVVFAPGNCRLEIAQCFRRF